MKIFQRKRRTYIIPCCDLQELFDPVLSLPFNEMGFSKKDVQIGCDDSKDCKDDGCENCRRVPVPVLLTETIKAKVLRQGKSKRTPPKIYGNRKEAYLVNSAKVYSLPCDGGAGTCPQIIVNELADNDWDFKEIGFGSKAEIKKICCVSCRKNGDGPVGCKLNPILLEVSQIISATIL